VFRFDSQFGAVNPESDLMKGACVEWFSPQYWTTVSDGSATAALAALDAPLVSLGDINRGRWPEEFKITSSSVFSYVANNYWFTNTPPGQGGEFLFRYAVTSGPQIPPEQLARWGAEARSPLEVGHLRHFDKIAENVGFLPPNAASLASVEPDNLILGALKLSEDWRSIVVRIVETAGRSGEGMVHLPLLKIQTAAEANAVEVPGKSLLVEGNGARFSFSPRQVLTVRISLDWSQRAFALHPEKARDRLKRRWLVNKAVWDGNTNEVQINSLYQWWVNYSE
jgi:alpha-mannosidase